jgi:ubiquitin-conjugating enzyme E2 D/E
MKMSVTDKRLQKELCVILKNKIEGIDILPNNDNLREWTVFIDGPKCTPYEDGVFNLNFQFSDKYPFEPPKVRFVTPIMHPNINLEGKVCINLFRDGWSASMTVQKILLSIISLLSSPNPNDPLMPEIAIMYANNYDKYTVVVKKYTIKHAMKHTIEQ